MPVMPETSLAVGYRRVVSMCCFNAEKLLARLDRHHDFLERAVAGAFADAVDRAFDLAGTGMHGGEAVGDRHAEVVVAMHGLSVMFSMPGTLALQVAEQLGRTPLAPCSPRYPGTFTVVAPASIAAVTTSAR